MAELEMQRIRTGLHHLKAIAFVFCTVSANASALLRTFRSRKERCRFLYLILRKMTPLLFALISAGFFNVGPVRVCIPGNGVTPFFGSSSSHPSVQSVCCGHGTYIYRIFAHNSRIPVARRPQKYHLMQTYFF